MPPIHFLKDVGTTKDNKHVYMTDMKSNVISSEVSQPETKAGMFFLFNNFVNPKLIENRWYHE